MNPVKTARRAMLCALVLTLAFVAGVVLALRARPGPLRDDALRRAVNQSLGMPAHHHPTAEELGRLEGQLSVYAGERVESLEGLEHAVNLTGLHLVDARRLEDLSPLAGLELEYLCLWIYDGTDWGSLLEPLEDPAAGEGAPRKKDGAPAPAFYRRTVRLDLSPIADMHSLRTLRLLAVGVRDEDLAHLAGLTGLERLVLSGNPEITSVEALRGLEGLTSLGLTGSAVSDLSPLAGLDALTELYLDDNDIADISPLAGLTGLRRLDLHSNGIVDVSALAGMTGLRELDLSNNHIGDISPLAGLTGLHELDLSLNLIADMDPVPIRRGMLMLDLSWNPIGDFGFLERVELVQQLHLDGCGITDLAALPLDGARIARLSVADNLFTDASPILDWELYGLIVGGNPIADYSVLDGPRADYPLGVTVDSLALYSALDGNGRQYIDLPVYFGGRQLEAFERFAESEWDGARLSWDAALAGGQALDWTAGYTDNTGGTHAVGTLTVYPPDWTFDFAWALNRQRLWRARYDQGMPVPATTAPLYNAGDLRDHPIYEEILQADREARS